MLQKVLCIMMSNGEKIVASVLAILTGLLVWFGYGHGVDNLSVLLTVGGGIVLSMLGNSGNSENGMLICVVLIIVGALFALTGTGILVAGALLLAAIFACVGSAIILNA